MGGFLSGLGDIAGGVAQGLGPDLQQFVQLQQQNKQDSAVGEAALASLGLPPIQQTPQQGGIGGVLSGLLGGGQQGQQAPPSPPPQQQAAPISQAAPLAQAPPAQMSSFAPQQLGQGGAARSPMPIPQAAPQQAPFQAQAAPNAPAPQPTPQGPPQGAATQAAPSAPPALQGATPTPLAPPPTPGPPVPAGQPKVAQPGVTAPGQQAVPGPTPAAQLMAQPQSQPPPQQQDPGRQQAALDQFKGMFDYPTMVRNLRATPGMTTAKLGTILRSPAFTNMLNQQGLAQYRALQLGQGQQRINETGLRDSTRAGEADRRSADVERAQQFRQQATVYSQGAKQGQAMIAQINKDTGAKISAIIGDFNIKQEDKQKAIDALNSQRDEAIDKITKKIGDPPEMGKEESSASDQGGGAADIAHDPKTGKMYRYKGSGDRGDMNSYTPLN